MDKIILIFYINVSGMTPEGVGKYISNLKKEIGQDDIIKYFIPVVDKETKVECINPKLISGDEYNKIREILDRNQEIVDYISTNTIENISITLNRNVKINDLTDLFK